MGLSNIVDAETAAASWAGVADAWMRVAAELYRETLRDPLTGLRNAAGFEVALEALAQAEDDSVCVVYIDLDGFKAVNDTCGHAVGDDILRQVAGRLRLAVRAGDRVARLGGDEFAVALPCAIEVHAVIRRIAAHLREPIRLDGDRSISVSASMGIASRRPTEALARLTARADAAMYRAKRRQAQLPAAPGAHLMWAS